VKKPLQRVLPAATTVAQSYWLLTLGREELRAPPAKRRRTRKGRKSKSNGKEKPEENQPEVTQKESQAQDIEDEKTKERS
jgi:hypothetical protein